MSVVPNKMSATLEFGLSCAIFSIDGDAFGVGVTVASVDVSRTGCFESGMDVGRNMERIACTTYLLFIQPSPDAFGMCASSKVRQCSRQRVGHD